MKLVHSLVRGTAVNVTKSLLATPIFVGVALGAVLAVGSSIPASAAAASLPATDHIYAYDCTAGANDLQLLEILADGTATAIGTGTGSLSSECPGQPAWDPGTQRAYFILSGKLYSTNVSTGVSTEVATTSGAGGNSYLLGSPGLAIAPDGSAWVVGDCYVGSIVLATGAITLFPGTTNCDQSMYYFLPFAYNATDSELYIIDADNKTDDTPPVGNQLYVMNQATGVVTLGGGVTFASYQDAEFENFKAMVFDSSGRGWLMYVGGSPTISTLKSFDTATATVDDQGEVRLGGSSVVSYSIFIGKPTSGGGGGGGESPIDDSYLDYMRERVESENNTDLPNTGGSAMALNVVAGLGCLALGSTLVAVSRRRRYS